ncbi:MAG: queuosine precursor transporter, partial [Mycoplasmatales bacterium]
LLTIIIIMNIMLLSKPFVNADSMQMYESIANIFGVMPRIMFASMIAYLSSQSMDIIIYSKVKNKGDGSKLWIRNNVSTVTSQVIDGFIFTFLAFYGMFELSIVLEIFLTTFIIKSIIATLDTPFMYLGVKMYKENWINDYEITKTKQD